MPNKIPTFSVLNLLVNAFIQFDDQRFQSEFDILKKDLDTLDDTDLVFLTIRLDAINDYIVKCMQAIATAHADDSMLLKFDLDDNDPAVQTHGAIETRKERLLTRKKFAQLWINEADRLLEQIDSI